jgi:drug/metabolite transporter (DMT)-like permease
MYAVTQGAVFAALALLPAATLSLVLSMTPVVVALASWPLLGEPPGRIQLVGTALFVVGAAVYLGRGDAVAASLAGLAVAGVGLAANAAAALLGRRVNRDRHHPVVVTGVSMAVGAPLLLGAGLLVEGWVPPGPEELAIVAWLALVNTALAFTLWNRTLRHLSATESSVLNNTMMIQIAILAWVFLGEALVAREIAGLVLAACGALIVQVRRRTRRLGVDLTKE